MELVNWFLFQGYHCSVELVKVFSYWLSSKFELHITYQFLMLLFHYFRTNFSPTWKNYTMKYIVNTTKATTLSMSRRLRMKLLTHSFKRLSSVNQRTRHASESLNSLFKVPMKRNFLLSYLKELSK